MSDSTESEPVDESRVVVGVDGSEDSVAALRAAANAAGVLQATLVVVTTWLQGMTFGRTPLWLPDFQRETEEMQASVIREAFPDGPPVRLHRVVRSGAPGPVIVRESDGAKLAVVGRRGHGGFAGLLLGSAAMSVVVHAHCPVLVLRHGARIAAIHERGTRPARRVVVGVDGDAPSLRALAAAARAAAVLDARLDVVTAWSTFGGYPETMGELREDMAESARERQRAAIEQVVEEGDRDRVHRTVREGGASAVLVGESDGADLLVVGIRSRSAFVEAFTGTAALTTAAHADCPVLVVRAANGHGGPRRA